MEEERAKLRKEELKTLYRNLKEDTWNILSTRNLLRAKGGPLKKVGILPVVEWKDYWTIVRRELLNNSSLNEEERKVAEDLIKTIEKTFADVAFRVLSEYYERMPEVVNAAIRTGNTSVLAAALSPTVLATVSSELERRRAMNEEWGSVLLKLIRDPTSGKPSEFRRELLLNPPMILSFAPRKERPIIRFHLILPDEDLAKKYTDAIRRGLADYFALPYLVHFDPEDVPELFEKEELLDIILHPNAEHLANSAVKLGHKPIEIVRKVAQLPDPDHLLSYLYHIPEHILHPELLEELSKLDKSRYKELIDGLVRLKEVLKGSSEDTVRRVIFALKENPELHKYIFHRSLVENVDLLLEAYKRSPAVLETLFEVRKHLRKHDSKSMRRLLELALKTNKPDLIKVLAPHPDLSNYYEILARYLNLPHLRALLDEKEKWKGIRADQLERALNHPLGVKLLLSDIKMEEKQQLLDRLDEIKENDIVARELVHRWGLDEEIARFLAEQLGERAKDFMEKHGHIIEQAEKDHLPYLVEYYSRKGGNVDPDKLKVLLKLIKAGGALDRDILIKTLDNLSQSEVSELRGIPDDILRAFFLARLSSPQRLEEELKAFLRDRRETSKRMKIVAGSPETELKRKILEGIEEVDERSGTVRISKKLGRRLGTSEGVYKIKELRDLVMQYLLRQGLSRGRAREVTDEVLKRVSSRKKK